MVEAVLGNDVEIALLGGPNGDDILSLFGQLKALRGLEAIEMLCVRTVLEAYMIYPTIIPLFALFADCSGNLPLARAVLKDDHFALPRRPVDLFHQERVVADPSHFGNDALGRVHFARPGQAVFCLSDRVGGGVDRDDESVDRDEGIWSAGLWVSGSQFSGPACEDHAVNCSAATHFMSNSDVYGLTAKESFVGLYIGIL